MGTLCMRYTRRYYADVQYAVKLHLVGFHPFGKADVANLGNEAVVRVRPSNMKQPFWNNASL